MTQPETLRLADALADPDASLYAYQLAQAATELRRLSAENASLAAALASSCDEQRHELWESGGIAGCERARVAERQRDALLEALRDLVQLEADGRTEYESAIPHWDAARAAIKAVEETK